MRRITLVLAAAAVLLTGCAPSTVQSADVESTTSSTSASPSATPTTGPVEVEVEPTEPSTEQTAADSVLVGIQLTVASYGIDVKADEIRSASDYACDQLAAGVPAEQIAALTGDAPEGANRDLVQLARDEYCPIR